MSDNSRKKKLDTILIRMSSYYNTEMTADVIELYHQSLAEYDIKNIGKAAGEHIRACKWFPKISELVDRLKPHVPQIESRADQQAAHVLSMIGRLGYLHEPRWEDPVTRALFTSRRFSWRTLCNTLTEEETKWWVKDFKAAYANFNSLDPVQLLEAVEKVKMLTAQIGGEEPRPDPGPIKWPVRGLNLRKFTAAEIKEQQRQLLAESNQKKGGMNADKGR